MIISAVEANMSCAINPPPTDLGGRYRVCANDEHGAPTRKRFATPDRIYSDTAGTAGR